MARSSADQVGGLRDGVGGAHASTLSCTPHGSARSAAARAWCRSPDRPRRCVRPPNTTATRRNHPQPRARPATTSLTQWTPSSARLVATTIAIERCPAGQHRPHRPRPITSEHERHGGPAGGGRGRVAGRERVAVDVHQLQDRRALTPHDDLDQVVEEILTESDDGHEQEHLAVAAPDEVRRGDDSEHDEHHPRGTEIGDDLDHVHRLGAGVGRTPLGHLAVDVLHRAVVVDEDEQQPEHQRSRRTRARRRR